MDKDDRFLTVDELAECLDLWIAATKTLRFSSTSHSALAVGAASDSAGVISRHRST